MGFDKSRFTTAIDEELMCNICFGVLEDPIMLKCCEHAFCRACIRHWMMHQATCPFDRSPLDADNFMAPPRIMRNLISRLIIKCEYPECQELIAMESYKAHLRHCPKNTSTRGHVDRLDAWTSTTDDREAAAAMAAEAAKAVYISAGIVSNREGGVEMLVIATGNAEGVGASLLRLGPHGAGTNEGPGIAVFKLNEGPATADSTGRAVINIGTALRRSLSVDADEAQSAPTTEAAANSQATLGGIGTGGVGIDGVGIDGVGAAGVGIGSGIGFGIGIDGRGGVDVDVNAYFGRGAGGVGVGGVNANGVDTRIANAMNESHPGIGVRMIFEFPVERPNHTSSVMPVYDPNNNQMHFLAFNNDGVLLQEVVKQMPLISPYGGPAYVKIRQHPDPGDMARGDTFVGFSVEVDYPPLCVFDLGHEDSPVDLQAVR